MAVLRQREAAALTQSTSDGQAADKNGIMQKKVALFRSCFSLVYPPPTSSYLVGGNRLMAARQSDIAFWEAGTAPVNKRRSGLDNGPHCLAVGGAGSLLLHHPR